MKDTNAKQMKPIAAACRIPDIGIFILKIGKCNDKKINGLGCRLANGYSNKKNSAGYYINKRLWYIKFMHKK